MCAESVICDRLCSAFVLVCVNRRSLRKYSRLIIISVPIVSVSFGSGEI